MLCCEPSTGFHIPPPKTKTIFTWTPFAAVTWLDENASTPAPAIDWPEETLQFVSNDAIIVLGDSTIGDSSEAAHRHASTSTQYLAGYTASKEVLGVFRLKAGAQGTAFTWYNVHSLPPAVKGPICRQAVEFARVRPSSVHTMESDSCAHPPTEHV